MLQATNKPYVKQYDENGVLINPINGRYSNNGSNRRNRKFKRERFMNNSGSTQLAIYGRFAYKKRVQLIQLVDGKEKKIFHYDPKK